MKIISLQINLKHGRHDNLDALGGPLEVAIRDLVAGKFDEQCEPCQEEDYDFIEA